MRQVRPTRHIHIIVFDLPDAGVDLFAAQQLAGHTSVVTTARYDRCGEQTKRAAIEKLYIPYVGNGVSHYVGNGVSHDAGCGSPPNTSARRPLGTTGAASRPSAQPSKSCTSPLHSRCDDCEPPFSPRPARPCVAGVPRHRGHTVPAWRPRETGAPAGCRATGFCKICRRGRLPVKSRSTCPNRPGEQKPCLCVGA